MTKKDEEVPGMADAIERRRLELDLRPTEFVRASGLSEPGLMPVRKGLRRRYKEQTIVGVAAALQWPRDWYQRLLDGEDPETWRDDGDEQGPRSEPPAPSFEERLSAVESALDEVRRGVAELLRRQEGP